MLAYLMLHQLDGVGLVVHDHELRTMLPPTPGRREAAHADPGHSGKNDSPGGGNASGPGSGTDLAGQLRGRGMLAAHFPDCLTR